MSKLRKQKIVALKFARETEIVTESICWALRQAADENPDLSQAVCELRDYIASQIGHGFLESWLEHEAGIFDPWCNKVMLRKTRIAWIDWMINCLENPA